MPNHDASPFHFSHRMKPKLLLILPLPAAAIAGVVFAQGPLTPPGAPAPVMKSLEQVEPRTPVSSLPFTISQSGSYYLTSNLQFTAVGLNAITITASNVTLDLNGFTLSSTVTADGEAIRVEPHLHVIVVRNGAITGTSMVTITGAHPNRTWAAVPGGFATGINALDNDFSISECRFEDLTIRGCRTDGLATGPCAVVQRVTSTHNGGNGIFAGDSSSVTNCIATRNMGAGIYVSDGAVSACTVEHNRYGGFSMSGGSISGCSARWNGEIGIFADRTSISHCHVMYSEGTGIRGVNCSTSHCVASWSGSDGIYSASGVIAFCLAESNNRKNDGSVNIDAGGTVTRTGNYPP